MGLRHVTVASVVLATLACGGSGGGSAPAEAMIADLRFTQWECYEGGYYEGMGFKADGRCEGSSDGWGCTYTQGRNAFTIEWTGPDGEKETWSGIMVDPAGKEMGGTSFDGKATNDFRCTRD